MSNLLAGGFYRNLSPTVTETFVLQESTTPLDCFDDVQGYGLFFNLRTSAKVAIVVVKYKTLTDETTNLERHDSINGVASLQTTNRLTLKLLVAWVILIAFPAT